MIAVPDRSVTTGDRRDLELTIIVPAYNDADGLAGILPGLVETCLRRGWGIIVVDDGSTDHTTRVLEGFGGRLRVLRNEVNLGYGASIKRAIRVAGTEWVGTFDADGQHRLEDLEKLVDGAGCCDAVIGRREPCSYNSWIRMPGKWILSKIANLLVGRKIADINCGLRIFRRQAMMGILSLTSDSFSFATSSLVALLKLGYKVTLIPVTTQRRTGSSTVRQFKDGFNTILLILRLITLFDPLRVMLPFAIAFFLSGVVYQLWSFAVYGFDLNKLTVLLWIFAVVTFLVALLADQVSALRRELAVYPMNRGGMDGGNP